MMDEDAIVNPINDAERVSVYGTHNDEKKTSEDDDSANLTVSEFNQLFKMHPYKPRLNGPIDSEYVKFRAKTQMGNGQEFSSTDDQEDESKPLLMQSQFIKVPASVVQDRVQRIVKLDAAATDAARSLSSCLEDNKCEKLIQKNGETVILTVRCVAFLNAPQSNEDHIGDGRLYITKSATSDGKKVKHRLYFYSYGESPDLFYEENSTSVSFLRNTYFEGDHVMISKLSTGFEKTVQERMKRSAEGVFLSLSLDDLIGAYHTLSDQTQLKSFFKGSASTDEETKCGDYSCLRNFLLCKWCMFSCKSCCSFSCCVMPCCQIKILVSVLMAKIWKWRFTAVQDENDLSRLISTSTSSVEKDLEALQYDPLNERDVAMNSFTTKSMHTKRFHTVNLSYLETSSAYAKQRGVIVLAPDEDSALAVDLVCLLTSITDELRSQEAAATTTLHSTTTSNSFDKTRSMPFSGRDPLKESALLRGKEDVVGLLGDLFSGGGTIIKVTITWEYKVAVCYSNILLAFICFIACIAALAAGSSPLLVLNLLYSLAHGTTRTLDRNETEYKTFALIKDCLAAFFGLLFSIISTASSSGGDSTTDAALAFSYLQSFVALFGAGYQLRKHLLKRMGPDPMAVV
jgi:hypothetical protein